MQSQADTIVEALEGWSPLAGFLNFEARSKYSVAVSLKPCSPGPSLWVQLHIYNTDTRNKPDALGWTPEEILVDALNRAQALVRYHKRREPDGDAI
jgi:hypothetical protein